MNSDSHQTQFGNDSKGTLSKALRILKAAIERREHVLIDGFIQLGPNQLKDALEISYKDDWKRVFDYLVLHKGVVKKCVKAYMDFFSDLVSKNGPLTMRKVFGIEDKKYDLVFEEIYDLVAVSNGSLYKYVEFNKFDFVMMIREGKAGDLQEQLGLKSRKYQYLWLEILDLLMESVCDAYYDERTFDQGLNAFSMLMSGIREQRSLRSFSKMWEYSIK